MKIRKIELDEMLGADGEMISNPIAVTVDMSITEALYLVRLLGKMNDWDTNAIIRGGSQVDIYGCLTGDLFNRFWDDGDRDALRDLELAPHVDDVEAARTRGKLMSGEHHG